MYGNYLDDAAKIVAEKREENWFNEPNLVDRILNSIEKIKKLANKRKYKRKS